MKFFILNVVTIVVVAAAIDAVIVMVGVACGGGR